MNNTLLAVLSGIGSMLGWGSSDFFTKKATAKLHEYSILFWSQIFGAIPLFVYLIISGNTFSFNISSLPLILVFALFYGIGYALYFRAISIGNLSLVSPTLSAYGGSAVLVSVLIFGETLSINTIIAIVVMFIGVILMSIDWQDFKKNNNKISLSAGIAEALIALVIFSFWYPIWDSRFADNPDWFSDVIVLRFGMAFTFLMIALVSKAKLLPQKGQQKDFSVIKLLLAVGLLDGIGFLAFNLGYGLTDSTSIVTIIGSAYALPTIVLAAIFLKERLNKLQILGVTLIVLSLIAINLF